MDDNRRQHTRVKVPRVLVRISSVDKLRNHYLQDLSQGGLFVKAERTLPLGSEVDVELLPPGWDEPLILHGRVARVANDESARKRNQVGMGIKFEGLSNDVERRLQALVAEHSGGSLATAPAGELSEMDRLRAQLQGVAQQLGITQEELRARTDELSSLQRTLDEASAREADVLRERDELRARTKVLQFELENRPASEEPPRNFQSELDGLQVEIEAARTEVGELRAKLAEAEGAAEAYRKEMEVLEQDEAQTRALTERLAREKAVAEKTKKELADSLGAELAASRRDKEQLSRDLDAATRRGDELEKRLESEIAGRQEADQALLRERAARSQSEEQEAKTQRALEDARTAIDSAGSIGRELAAAQLQAAAERERSASLEKKLAETAHTLERSRAKERDLRRLLALVSPRDGDDDVVVVDGPTATEGPAEVTAPQGFSESEKTIPGVALSAFSADEEPLPELTPELSAEPTGEALPPMVEPNFDLGIEPTSEPIPTPAEPAFGAGGEFESEPLPPLVEPNFGLEAEAEPLPPPIEPNFDLGSDSLAPTAEHYVLDPPPSNPASDSGSVIVDQELGAFALPEPVSEEEASLPPPTPGDEALEDEPLVEAEISEEEGIAAPLEGAEFDLPAVDVVEEASPAERAADFEEFVRRLKAGERLIRTDKFNMHMPTEPTEIMVMGWLENADTLNELCANANGRMTEERIARVSYMFYNRDLIDLRVDEPLI